MVLKEIREAFEDGTTSANKINRQLIFSGIAIIWILKGGSNTSLNGIPNMLLWSIGLLALSLTFDLFQSLVHTWIWYFNYRSFKNEELAKHDDNDGLDESTIIVNEQESSSIITWVIWILKIMLTIIAYALLIVHLIKEMA